MAAVAAGWLLLRDNFVSAEYKDTNYLKMELNPAPVHLGFIIVGASPSAYPNLWGHNHCRLFRDDSEYSIFEARAFRAAIYYLFFSKYRKWIDLIGDAF